MSDRRVAQLELLAGKLDDLWKEVLSAAAMLEVALKDIKERDPPWED